MTVIKYIDDTFLQDDINSRTRCGKKPCSKNRKKYFRALRKKITRILDKQDFNY